MIKIDLKKNIAELPLSFQLLVAGLVCIVVFYCGYSWDIASLKKQIAKEQQQEQDLKGMFQFLFDSQVTMENDIAQLPKLQEMIKTWEAKFIKPDHLSDLLNEILKLGAASDLQFDLFSPGQEIKEGSYFKVPIKAEVRGNYKQIANFISEIANMQSTVVVGDFILSRVTIDTNAKKGPLQPTPQDLLKADIMLEIYYLGEKQHAH